MMKSLEVGVKNWIVTSLVVLAVVGVASAESLYVPASANAEGAAGTQWHTDLQVKAGGGESATATVELLKRGENNFSPLSAEFNIAPGQSLRLIDVVADVFGFSGTGALRVTATDGAILVTSRTFNDDPGGTYGQYVPAISDDEATPFGSTVSLLQLSRSSETSDGFRANIGFVNVTSEPIYVEVDLFDADGSPFGTVERRLKRYGYFQFNDIFSMVDAVEVADGYAMVRTTSEGGRFISYASIVDNRSGDAIFIPGQIDDPPVEEQEKLIVFEILTRDT